MESKKDLTNEEIDRIINMAWEDRTPFEAITFQFGLSEPETIALMRKHLRPSNWRKWRQRVRGRKTKHAKLRTATVERFKSSAQRTITNHRISKKKY